MNKELIASKFFKHLDDTALIGYSDFDEVIGGFRVCIDLNTYSPLDISTVDVQDDNWCRMRIESLELEAYLLRNLEDYISRNKELIKQQKEIREDEKR